MSTVAAASDPHARMSTVDVAFGLTLRRVAIPSGDISYIDEGSGRPVVLLHGAPITSLGFVRVIRTLRGRCRVLAPDLPGFGDSVAAPGFPGSLASYASAVREFCAALDLRGFVVYVNDASGAFGLAAAAAMRDRVAGVVVADTVPIPLTGAAGLVGFALRHVVPSRPVRFVNRHWNVFPWLVATAAPWRRPFRSAERRALLAPFDTAARRDRVLDLFAEMGRDDTFMRATAHAVAERLAATPALLLYGQFDPMRLIGGIRRYATLFPRHRVCIVPWEEHFPILAEGEAVAVAVQGWLETLS
jgi:pimeloyl-ACP methyl ester carboxylesterase